MGKIKRDGHIHSPYCPHGTKDSFKKYIEKAIEEGLEEISFTEHLPLPSVIMENKKYFDCAPTEEDFEKYIYDLKILRKEYVDKIKINIGAEVDYIEGLEEETKKILNKYGIHLEDSILSVHFINIEGKYYAVDYGEKEFKELIDLLGGIDKVYDKYFETLLMSVDSDLGKYKPKRIGHPTLVRKLNLIFPYEYDNEVLLERVVKRIHDKNYEIDHNTAGLRKVYCKEEYPSGKFKEFVEKYNIKEVYGSDSHESKDVAYNFSKY
ncbi:MAG: histidinol-phosphatase HisJ [Clostridium sp.]|nr:histidinol-phosphatase HisJ [Clostridium sp.]